VAGPPRAALGRDPGGPFPVSDVALSPAGDLASLVSDVIGIAGFGVLGWRLLTAPDASWDEVPAAADPGRDVPVALVG
jgi:hypothetical protein